jgi:DNA-binding transcriptional LysR family regulator
MFYDLLVVSLRQLEYLVTIIDAGSFTRAAKLLRVTQPALSHQVRALEHVVGGPLLERLPRSVRLTAMGRAMLPHARAALVDVERAVGAARHTSGLESGELQLATLNWISLGILPPVLRAWREAYRGAGIRLYEHCHHAELAAAVAGGQADLGVGPQPVEWEGPVRSLGVEEFVVVVSNNDPLARDGPATVRFNELAKHSWVHYAPEDGLCGVLDQACAHAGFQPSVGIRTEQAAAAPVFAAAGLGLALVPRSLLSSTFDGCVLRPEPPVVRTITAFTRGGPDALTATFIEALATHVASSP